MSAAPSRKAVVIGGGPAGLAAAERLAGAGIAVDLYEQMPTVGRKLMMAGRGGLNLTHGEAFERFLARYGAARDDLAPSIAAFPPARLRVWADELGQETFEGSSGRIFPKAMKASPLLRAWLARLARLGVTIHTRHRWRGWHGDGALVIERSTGEPIVATPDVTILALGGGSWPRLGSDGAWTAPLAAAGVAITPLSASNAAVRIEWSPVFRGRFEGEPVKRLTIACDGETVVGEAIIKADGLEGGAIYALNRRIAAALARDGMARVLIDVRPSFSLEELTAKLSTPRKKQSTANFLRKVAGMAPVAIGLVREGAGGGLPSDPGELAQAIKAIPLTVTGLGDLARAISTAGGVRFDALDDDLMLVCKPGVFVAGEMLDWDAPTGGYLLQATFATAIRAADGACRWLGRETPMG